MMILLCLWLLFATVEATSDQQLIEWVRSKGGYWNPKQQMGYDASGLFGVFAAEAIEEDEVLASLPWDVVITTNSSRKRFENCDTVRLLAEELDKVGSNASSDFSLYAQTLKGTAEAHARLLPTYWSPEGQALLNHVLDNGILPPFDPFLKSLKWKQACDEVSETATSLVMTHGEAFGMVPVTDRYNCRGGEYTGAYFSVEGRYDSDAATEQPNVALEVRAWRDLEPGEQIYTDYKDYGLVGTPELLRDYGFVESYPQRYIFSDLNLAFDIDVEEGGKLVVEWLTEGVARRRFSLPSDTSLEILREQLGRLQLLYPSLQRQNHPSIPLPELETIRHFCGNMISALATATGEASTLAFHGDQNSRLARRAEDASEKDTCIDQRETQTSLHSELAQ